MQAWVPFLPLVLAVSTILLVIVAAFLLTRVIRRRERKDARTETQNLVERFEDFFDGQLAQTELRQAVRRTRRGAFWSAIETVAIDWSRAERHKLSRVLERNRHAVRERRALRDDSPWRRELAALRLGLLSSPRSRRALRKALIAGPEWVTFAAAKSLAHERDARTLRWVLDHPQRLAGRNPQAKVALLRHFGRGALPVLATTLATPYEDAGFERAMIEVLGLGRYQAAAPLIATRLKSANLEVRIAAGRALGRLHATECADALLEAVSDERWQVRAQAAWALGRAGVTQAVPTLTAKLEDSSWWVRRHAAYALREIRPEGLVALKHAIESSADPYARDMAREALEVEASGSA